MSTTKCIKNENNKWIKKPVDGQAAAFLKTFCPRTVRGHVSPEQAEDQVFADKPRTDRARTRHTRDPNFLIKLALLLEC